MNFGQLSVSSRVEDGGHSWGSDIVIELQGIEMLRVSIDRDVSEGLCVCNRVVADGCRTKEIEVKKRIDVSKIRRLKCGGEFVPKEKGF